MFLRETIGPKYLIRIGTIPSRLDCRVSKSACYQEALLYCGLRNTCHKRSRVYKSVRRFPLAPGPDQLEPFRKDGEYMGSIKKAELNLIEINKHNSTSSWCRKTAFQLCIERVSEGKEMTFPLSPSFGSWPTQLSPFSISEASFLDIIVVVAVRSQRKQFKPIPKFAGSGSEIQFKTNISISQPFGPFPLPLCCYASRLFRRVRFVRYFQRSFMRFAFAHRSSTGLAEPLAPVPLCSVSSSTPFARVYVLPTTGLCFTVNSLHFRLLCLALVFSLSLSFGRSVTWNVLNENWPGFWVLNREKVTGFSFAFLFLFGAVWNGAARSFYNFPLSHTYTNTHAHSSHMSFCR